MADTLLDDNIHKILDQMLDHPNMEYTREDLRLGRDRPRRSGLIRTSPEEINTALVNLQEHGIIHHTGNGFTLNEDSDKANTLGKLIDQLDQ